MLFSSSNIFRITHEVVFNLKKYLIKLHVFIPALIHYWPLCGGLNDVVGTTNFADNCPAPQFGKNKFEVSNAAVSIKPSCYLSLPPAVYFPSGDLTIALWIQLNSYSLPWPQIWQSADTNNWVSFFFNGATGNLCLYYGTKAGTGLPWSVVQPVSQPGVQLNTWTHLAATLLGKTGTIYINAQQVVTGTMPNYRIPPNTLQNYANVGIQANSLNAQISEFKIFSKALPQTEIQSAMSSFYTSRNFSFFTSALLFARLKLKLYVVDLRNTNTILFKKKHKLNNLQSSLKVPA